jgi:hypothetical protein
MKFLFPFSLNVFFFLLYAIVGIKIIEKTPFADFLEFENSVSWGKFFSAIIFFAGVSLVSILTSLAILAKSNDHEMKKGIALDDKDLEVTPDVTIDGKEENRDTLMDLIDDKSGKIFTEPAKQKKKKKNQPRMNTDVHG